MASLNQVSIEFVTQGEKNMISALAKVDQGQQKLERSAKSLESAIKRGIATEEQAISAYLALAKSGLAYQDVLKGLEQNTKMLGAAHQANINGLLGVNKATKSARDSARALSDAFEEQERVAAINLKTAQSFGQLVTRVNTYATANKSAADSASVFIAQNKQVNQSYNQLRATIDQSYNVRMRLRQAAQTLRAAEQQGIITREQAIAQLREYRTVAQQAAIGTQFASRRLNSFGVVAQQTGYQVGDFLVQIQGGTNIFVALGQQLTQLIGTFGIFAKSLRAITIISGLGIIVPILTAIGAAFMRTKEEADGASDRVEKFESALNSARSEIESTRDQLRLLQSGFENAFQLTLTDNIEAARKELDAALAELEARRAAFEQRAIAPGGTGFMTGDIPVDPDAEAQIEAARERVRLAEAELVAAEAIFKIKQARNEETSREVSEGETLLENLRQRVYEQQVLFGLEGQALREAENRLEIERLYKEMLEAGIEPLSEQWNEAVRLTQEFQSNRDAAEAVADAARNIGDEISVAVTMANNLGAALARAAAAGQSRARQLAVAQAQIEAVRAGESPGVAAVRAGAEFDVAQSGGGADPIAVLAAGSIAEAEQRALEEAQNILDPLLNPPSGGTGTSGAGATGYTGLFPALFEAYEEAERLSKEYGEEVEILDFALEEGLITQEKYNQEIARAQEAYNQSAEAANQYEDIILRMANTTSDAIGQAMMDIVTGTKSASDAFSDMARTILKKAFELLVINPIINSIFGGSGLDIKGFNPLPSLVNANGNVFHNGAHVQAFATGGVVGSPTYFPMANGGVGLMGEAGPEAIMPLKRGKGGRLGVEVSGDQGNVVINQTFAFQANGDDSVKRIIASEAPRIAALTQKQMLDARRRGGVVRDTFA